MFATDARKKHATRIDIPCIRGKKIQTETLPIPDDQINSEAGIVIKKIEFLLFKRVRKGC